MRYAEMREAGAGYACSRCGGHFGRAVLGKDGKLHCPDKACYAEFSESTLVLRESSRGDMTQDLPDVELNG
jgi:hypothetical protein